MTRKPRGYWQDPKNITLELDAAIQMNNGTRPTQKWLREHGFSSLVNNLASHGVLSSLLNDRFGEREYRPDGFWQDPENFNLELRKAIDTNSCERPSQKWLCNNGFSSLCFAVKYHGGSLRTILDEIFGEIGSKPKGYWRDSDNFNRELDNAINECDGNRPTVKWLNNNGYSGIVQSARYHGGSLTSIINSKLSVHKSKDLKPMGYWKNKENYFKELDVAIQKNEGNRPTIPWLLDNGYRGIVANAKYYGGTFGKLMDDYFSEDTDEIEQLESLLDQYVHGGELND